MIDVEIYEKFFVAEAEKFCYASLSILGQRPKYFCLGTLAYISICERASLILDLFSKQLLHSVFFVLASFICMYRLPQLSKNLLIVTAF